MTAVPHADMRHTAGSRFCRRRPPSPTTTTTTTAAADAAHAARTCSQLLHSTPLRQMWPSMTLLRPADLRRRRLGGLSGQQSLSGLLPAETAAASASAAAAADPLVLGNASYAARMQAAAPSRQSLGRLAGQLRQSLG